MSKSVYIPLGGGIDLTSPPRQMAPGSAFYAVNYECPITGGYRRIAGYTKIAETLPGTGPVLGVKTFCNNYIAIRGNGDGTASIYKCPADGHDHADGETVGWTLITGGDKTLNEARHEFAEGNFYATDAKHALYFVGQGKPWELDTEGNLTELSNAPSGAHFIAIHMNHLFLGFEPGSLQFSGVGTPNAWGADTDGAGEIGVGDTLTGLLSGRGDVLHVGCCNSMKGLYGTSAQNFQMKNTLPGSGCKAYTLQSMMEPYFCGDRGITNLQASSKFGDFAPFQAGAKIEPLFAEAGYSCHVVASMVSRELAQYRVFFDDKTGVYYSPTGATTVEFLDRVMVTDSSELKSGEEVLLFGDDAGNVYRLGNSAESFNGEKIRAFITTAYTDLKAPDVIKRFRRAFFDMKNFAGTSISIKATLDFGDYDNPNQNRHFIDYIPKGGLWSIDKWNEFAWSSPIMAVDPISLTGSGDSINFAIFAEDTSTPHVIYGYSLTYQPRRARRG